MNSNLQSYASCFGGFSKKLDRTEIEIELKKRGYETPYNGIWNKISVIKNDQLLAMIDTNESSYTKNGNMYKWYGVDEFINQYNKTI